MTYRWIGIGTTHVYMGDTLGENITVVWEFKVRKFKQFVPIYLHFFCAVPPNRFGQRFVNINVIGAIRFHNLEEGQGQLL